jgi:hypothetical protein
MLVDATEPAALERSLRNFLLATSACDARGA